MKKRNIGKELIEGLKQAIDHSKGKITLKTTAIEIPDAPPKITKKDVAHIRNDKLHMSQGMFANLLGVSPAVIQSWEQGKKKPSGDYLFVADDGKWTGHVNIDLNACIAKTDGSWVMWKTIDETGQP